jgi:hypothetical protein
MSRAELPQRKLPVAVPIFANFTSRFRSHDSAPAAEALSYSHPPLLADKGKAAMSPALDASFFAPQPEFFRPRKKPSRPALPPPPPPPGNKRERLSQRLARRLLAMDPIAFMLSLLLATALLVVGLWDAMGLVLPL